MATPQRGSGFVGLDKYLAANRNKANEMAGVLSGNVDKTGQEAERGLYDIQEQFLQDVNAGIPQYNENGELLTQAEALERSKATYKGPKRLSDLAGWGALQDKAGKAAQGAAGLTSLAGRQAALQDQYGKEGGYSPGQQRFDSFLSGAAGGGRFQELKDKYGALSAGLGGANASSEGVSSAAEKGVKADAARYGNMIPGLQAQEAADKAAKAKADLEAQQEKEANEAAGGTGRPGQNAKNVADEKRGRGKPTTPTTAVGGRSAGGVSDTEARRVGRIIHGNLGGWF